MTGLSVECCIETFDVFQHAVPDIVVSPMLAFVVATPVWMIMLAVSLVTVMPSVEVNHGPELMEVDSALVQEISDEVVEQAICGQDRFTVEDGFWV